MAQTDEEILTRELSKLGAMGGGLGGALGASIDLRANKFAVLTSAVAGGVGGIMSTSTASKKLVTEKAELSEELAQSPQDLLRKVYEILSREGNIFDRQNSSPNPCISATVGSGFLNLNPAIVSVEIVPTSTKTKIVLTASAKEGLIKQHSAEKAANRIMALSRVNIIINLQ